MGEQMSTKTKSVIGENSNVEYEIDREIGKGSQGRVFAIKGEKYAFKLLGKKSAIKAQLLKRKISYIKTRDIKELPISRPIEQISGNFLGYIMEMATDMMPLENLLKPTFDSNWWHNTGGLKKRLLILEKLSKVLLDLHTKGLIYGDLSPKNIFISTDPKYAEVFLVDVDNITHESKVGEAVYTLSYAAPEIIKGTSGSDTYTDDFSFSIIAYQLLTLNHPFIGDYISDGEPEFEEEAYACDVPWIAHSKNTINKSSRGMNQDMSISKLMMKEFTNTFEKKLKDKYKRTTTLKWNEVLKNALNAVLTCPNCRHDYFYNKALKCSFCEDSLDYIGVITIYPLLAKLKKELSSEYNIECIDKNHIGQKLLNKIVQPDKYITIIEHDLFLNNSSIELFNIKVAKDYIFIKGIHQQTLSVCKDGKVKKDIDISMEIKVSQDNWLIFSKDVGSDYQRILKVRKSK